MNLSRNDLQAIAEVSAFLRLGGDRRAAIHALDNLVTGQAPTPSGEDNTRTPSHAAPGAYSQAPRGGSGHHKSSHGKAGA